MDEQQHEQFVRLWIAAQPSIAGYVRALVPDFHQAEDLVQEIAVLLMRKFDSYDPSRPFVPWALGFAKYEVMSSRRSHARSFLTYHSDVVESLTAAYEEVAQDMDGKKGSLHKCLQQVKGRNRKMLSMRYWEKLKPHEIAKRLTMNPTAVRVALTRVRGALLKCMKQRSTWEVS